MPGRPPREWFRRCVEAVTAGAMAGSGALDPAAVCGATWQRKSRGSQRAAIALEERVNPMTAKKKKKKHPKKKGTKKARHLAAKHAAEARALIADMNRIARGK